MTQMWKAVCKVKDLMEQRAHTVARGLAWQELPGVQVRWTEDQRVVACLEGGDARTYAVKVEGDKVFLDLNELNAPASRAEAALARHYATTPHI